MSSKLRATNQNVWWHLQIDASERNEQKMGISAYREKCFYSFAFVKCNVSLSYDMLFHCQICYMHCTDDKKLTH